MTIFQFFNRKTKQNKTLYFIMYLENSYLPIVEYLILKGVNFELLVNI